MNMNAPPSLRLQMVNRHSRIDDTRTITVYPLVDLEHLVETSPPSDTLGLASRLVNGVCKRRRVSQRAKVNRRRLNLAKLLINWQPSLPCPVVDLARQLRAMTERAERAERVVHAIIRQTDREANPVRLFAMLAAQA
jgi:hypothetical protein